MTLGISFVIFFLAVILPVFVLLWSSFIPYYGVPSMELVRKMTWANYQYILNYPLALTAFKNSFYLSVGSATLVMLLTSVIAWVPSKRNCREEVSRQYDLYPDRHAGNRVGRSLIWVYLTLPIPIYGTIWVLLLAYMTKFIPYGIRAASSSMIQINKELEEASFDRGRHVVSNFRKVILPLLMPGFTAGWIYISIIALRELSTSILFTPIIVPYFRSWHSIFGRAANIPMCVPWVC